jgi:Lysophospholipase L1 and related esterases
MLTEGQIMAGNQNGRHRDLKGNALLAVVAVALCCVIIVAAVLLYRKIPAQAAGVSGTVQQSSSSSAGGISSAPPQSQPPSSSQTAPSSSGSASSSASGVSSASPVKLSAFDAATFKGALFIGDSFAEGVGLYYGVSVTDIIGKTSMTSYSALNNSYAIGGRTQTVTAAAAATGPDSIYIELGSNDVTMGRTPEKFTGYYGGLVDSLKSGCKGAKIYVQSVFPVSAAYEAKTGVTNAKIDAYNEALRAMCAQKGVTYLDVASALKGPDGKLQPDLSYDGLHMKKSGYSLWLSYLAGCIGGNLR